MCEERVFSIEGASKEFIEFLRLGSSAASYAISKTGSHRFDYTWYHHDDDIKESSAKFPEELVCLSCGADICVEYWRKYYRNGELVRMDVPTLEWPDPPE